MVLEEALEILKSHGAIARVDWEYRHLRMIGCTVYYVTREWRTNSGYVWVAHIKNKTLPLQDLIAEDWQHIYKDCSDEEVIIL